VASFELSLIKDRDMADSGQVTSCVLAGKKKLRLGSGHKKAADAVNVDIVRSTGPDICHDLNCLPWPLPDDWFEECQAYDAIEHLNDIVTVMAEIHRVCQDGAIVRITVPHFSCSNAFTDPTHRHYFSWFSLHYFTGEHEFSFYTESHFRHRHSRIVFAPTLLNKLVHRLANRYAAEYERRWAWMFPAWFLYFELEVVKDQLAR
jgi:SAM-dependent methyltransferase